MSASPPRVLLAKIGLDGHDRGLRMLGFALRERGAEVIMLGVGTTASQIASAAVQEDVDAIGVSIHSGAHLDLVPRMLDELRQSGSEIPVVCGGVIPPADVAALQSVGVAAVAPVGASLSAAVDLILEQASSTSKRSLDRRERDGT